MNNAPRTSLFPRSFSKHYPVATRGEGVYLWDSNGNRYMDLAASAVVNFIGHGDQDVSAAIARQLHDLEFVHSSQFVTQAALDFADQVLEFAGPAFECGAVFFTSGGSEAVESALKLARQYQVEIGQSARSRIISRKQSYHGSTFGAMSVSGNRQRREIYLPMLHSNEQVNTPYCYRCVYGCDLCAEKYAAEVAELLARTAHETAAFIFEPVSGATLGAVVPPNVYLQEVTRVCHDRGVLLIADEVMTGFGRTGRNFAVDHWNIAPDIIVAGKGISSGYAPLGAVIANKKVVDAIANGSGQLIHGFTYNAHPVSVAAGAAVLDKTKRLISEMPAIESHLCSELNSLQNCTSVGDVRGLGMLWAVEFVSDRNMKTPFAAARKFALAVGAAAMKRGVVVYPMQGCVDGINGDHVLIAPPAIITLKEIDWAVNELEAAICEVVRGN